MEIGVGSGRDYWLLFTMRNDARFVIYLWDFMPILLDLTLLFLFSLLVCNVHLHPLSSATWIALVTE